MGRELVPQGKAEDDDGGDVSDYSIKSKNGQER